LKEDNNLSLKDIRRALKLVKQQDCNHDMTKTGYCSICSNGWCGRKDRRIIKETFGL